MHTCLPNPFEEACEIEAAALEDIWPFLLKYAHDGRVVLTGKGTNAKELQKTAGDALFNCPAGKVWTVDWKIEVANLHNNFFLETWSNRSRYTLGWMYTLQTDILLYYFFKEKDLYSIKFAALREWAFIKGRIYDQEFPEKKQNKYKQMNDTWGRCVPIKIITDEVGLRHYNLLHAGSGKPPDQRPDQDKEA